MRDKEKTKQYNKNNYEKNSSKFKENAAKWRNILNLKFYFSPKFFLKTSKRFQQEIITELQREGHAVFTNKEEYDRFRSLSKTKSSQCTTNNS